MSLFDAHDLDPTHLAGCGGCTAMMVKLEVARQLNELLEPPDCGECTACLNDKGACLNPPQFGRVRRE